MGRGACLKIDVHADVPVVIFRFVSLSLSHLAKKGEREKEKTRTIGFSYYKRGIFFCSADSEWINVWQGKNRPPWHLSVLSKRTRRHVPCHTSPHQNV